MEVFLAEYYLAKALENLDDWNSTAVFEGQYDDIAPDLPENSLVFLHSSHMSCNT